MKCKTISSQYLGFIDLWTIAGDDQPKEVPIFTDEPDPEVHPSEQPEIPQVA